MARRQSKRLNSSRTARSGPRDEGTPPAAIAASTGGVVTVELDGVQMAWLEAIADLHGSSREDILREALRWYSARESDRVSRTKRYQAIALAARAEAWDPVSDHLAGLEVVAP